VEYFFVTAENRAGTILADWSLQQERALVMEAGAREPRYPQVHLHAICSAVVEELSAAVHSADVEDVSSTAAPP
jgi:hypothetical protein